MRNWIASWIPRVVVATVVVTVLEVVFWPTFDWSLPKKVVTQGTWRATAVVDRVQTRAMQAQSTVSQAFQGGHSRAIEPSQLPTVEARASGSGRISFLTSSGSRFFGRGETVQEVDGHQIVIHPGPAGGSK